MGDVTFLEAPQGKQGSATQRVLLTNSCWAGRPCQPCSRSCVFHINTHSHLEQRHVLLQGAAQWCSWEGLQGSESVSLQGEDSPALWPFQPTELLSRFQKWLLRLLCACTRALFHSPEGQAAQLFQGTLFHSQEWNMKGNVNPVFSVTVCLLKLDDRMIAGVLFMLIRGCGVGRAALSRPG